MYNCLLKLPLPLTPGLLEEQGVLGNHKCPDGVWAQAGTMQLDHVVSTTENELSRHCRAYKILLEVIKGRSSQILT
jgi:hypothetical protein